MSDTRQPAGDLLLRAWQLKVGGGVFFTGLATRFPDHATDLELIAAAERAAGDRVETVARAGGLEIDVDAVASGVLSHLAGLGDDLDAILQQSADQGRACDDLYHQLGQAGSGEHVVLATYLIDIEAAAVDFMDAMVEGKSEDRRSVIEAIIRD